MQRKATIMAARTFRIGILLALIALPLTGYAQLQVTSLKAIRKDLGSDGQYSFPLVSGGKPNAATRINAWLQSEQLRLSSLQVFTGHGKKSPFENVWPAPGSWQGIDSMSYKIVANTPGYLSLLILSEGSGAHTSDNSDYYNFDAGTGVQLQLEDLLTQRGLQLFQERVRKARLKRIDDFLAKLPKPSGAAKPSEDSAEDAAEAQRQLYTNCRAGVAEDDVRTDELSLEVTKLVVIREHCAPHAIEAVGDLWNFRNAYSFSSLRGELNAYGRCLLIERRDDCGYLREAPMRGELFGTIGSNRVTFYLGAEGNSSSYAYDKVGTFIPLSGGKQADGSYHFTEQPVGGKKAVFVLKRGAEGLAGNWTQEGNGKTLAVELH